MPVVTSPEVEPPVREPEPVDVVVGDRIKTMVGHDVIAERDFNPDADTAEHPAAQPAPENLERAPEPPKGE